MFFPTHCSRSHFHQGASLCALEIQWTTNSTRSNPSPSHHDVTSPKGAEWSKRFFPKPPFFFVKGTQFCFCSGKKDLAPGNSANVTFFGMVSSRTFPRFLGFLGIGKMAPVVYFDVFLQMQKKTNIFCANRSNEFLLGGDLNGNHDWNGLKVPFQLWNCIIEWCMFHCHVSFQ